jgi:hypothetical protein
LTSRRLAKTARVRSLSGNLNPAIRQQGQFCTDLGQNVTMFAGNAGFDEDHFTKNSDPEAVLRENLRA